MAMALADRGIVPDLIVVTADALSGKEVLITEGNAVDAVTASAGWSMVRSSTTRRSQPQSKRERPRCGCCRRAIRVIWSLRPRQQSLQR
jgi:hypothetical protein